MSLPTISNLSWNSKTKFNLLTVGCDDYTLYLVENIAGQIDNTRVFAAMTNKEARVLFQEIDFDIVLADFDSSDADQRPLINYMKEQKKMLPVVLLIERSEFEADRRTRLRFLSAGTTFFLEKPFTLLELIAVIKNLIVLNETYRGLEHAANIIQALNNAIEARDVHTHGHAERAANLAVKIFDRVGLTGEQRRDLYVGSLLHDIGKIGIPDEILKSTTKLTPEQYERIKQHPTIGRDICSGLHRLKGSLPVIYEHHERLDGSGYPEGKKGDEIHILAQISGIADVYEALTSDRSYREALSPKAALTIIEKEVNEGKLNGHFYSVLKSIVLSEDETFKPTI